MNTIIDVLRERAECQPDACIYTYLHDGETSSNTLTYKTLDALARALAVRLQKLAGPRETVLLLYPQGLDFVVAFFGCLYAGVVPVPAYLPHPRRLDARLAAIARDSSAKVALTTATHMQSVKAQLGFIRIETTDSVNEDAESWERPAITDQSLAFLQYTSGSTSSSKGVMVTHSNVLYNSQYIAKDFHYGPESVGVTWLPHFHDMGLIEGLLQPVVHGFRTFILPAVSFLQHPVRWLSAISRYQATHSGAPNFAYELCVQKIEPKAVDNLDLRSWKVAYNGAEPIRSKTLSKFAKAFAPSGFRPSSFYPAYGLAEATLKVCVQNQKPIVALEVDPVLLGPVVGNDNVTEAASEKFISCGTPHFSTIVTIVNPELLVPIEEGDVGEIWVSGPGVTLGYWKNNLETARTFWAKLGDSDREYLRTGDLGFMKSGELFVTGRLKDLIILFGRNHCPSDIELTTESALSKLMPGQLCVAFSVDANGEEQLVVAIELSRGMLKCLRIETLREIFNVIREAINLDHNISTYDIVLLKTATVPKTSSGKIQRFLLRNRYIAGSLSPIATFRPTGQSSVALPL